MQLNILYQDAHIIVCEKPAGTPAQSKSLYAKDMVSILKNELAKNFPQNREPYLGLIHRLDQPVGGIMVFAKTPQAAKDLSLQLQNNNFRKHYLAIVTSDLGLEKGKTVTLIDEMIQNKKENTSSIVSSKTKESKRAELSYTVLDTALINGQIVSLIDIALITGRHHQIRVQAAAHLGGIWGDKKYNPQFQSSKRLTTLCLYSYQLTFQHPVSKKEMTFKNVPAYDMFSKFSIR
ncbi:RluA family pseudouridine synthase [[Clostridium] polysaccharolyticum]|uniref:RNA pseudouridylate synthase n=1 Tax=[Clostridium] polysaccharolyticum TaxID=29364 RepID=A0A1I0EU88_9FIRM|nr:RluA family pseudouridine synthase [[Clostridium] polysaccharolyticum]SET48422.1 23S rRNA pseudouridine1911/1915/1917 synthase [[Clostridium] polysaccharolyticum]